MNKDLRTRTPAEELWLSRKAIGRTQASHAAWLGVSHSSLYHSEKNGPVPILTGLWKPISDPGITLLLALARRRAGLGLRGVAAEAGVSHMTILTWEVRGYPRLVNFWRKRGFTFS